MSGFRSMVQRARTSFSRKKKRHSLLGVLAVAALASSFVTSAAPANAALTSNMCEFAVVIAVRGTGAAAGSGSMHGGRAWSTGGWGNLAAMRTSIGQIADMPFYTEALAYPAASFDIDASIATGVNMLANEVNYINQTCPYAPIVLLGHSQGATVVSHLLTGPSALTSSARAAINSVAIFGDPAYRTGMATNYGNPPNNGIFSQGVAVWPKTALADYRFWGYPYGSLNTKGWVYRVREYCLPGDFFCQANPNDSNYAIHNNYGQFGTGVANWIQFMMTSFN